MRRLALAALVSALPMASSEAAGLQTFTLPNGLRVVLLEDHATPLVRATLRVTWDPLEAPPEKGGIGSFLGALLERAGPGFLPRSAFDRSVAASGVRLRFHPFHNRFDWTVSARSADQEAAMEALAHMVMRTSLEGPMVEALRLNLWRSTEASPSGEALRQRFLASLQHHTPLDEAALTHIGLADLESFHRRVVRPERAVLGLAGDLSLPQAKALVLLHLGIWGPGPLPSPTPGRALPSLMSHPEGAPEAWLGASLSTPTEKHRAAAALLAGILEDLPDTPLSRGPDGGAYLLSRETPSHMEALPSAIQALRTRWERLSSGLTSEALAIARKRWLQEDATLSLNPGRHLDRGLDRITGGAPQPMDIQAVTLEEVRAVLAASLASPRLLVLGVPKATLGAWLKEAPALAPWAALQDSTTTPKRDAKSK